jgi:Family of unknown function (DUF5995)
MISDVIGDPKTVDDVIRAMTAIDSALPDDDGVKWFNLLYLRVTEEVQADAVLWQDWEFLQRFDVAFARLYFDAAVAWERARELTPRAWRPLFAARHERTLARVQFALAGMNAHINRDLPIVLEQQAALDGSFPAHDSTRYADFLRVNDILERIETALRPVLATGVAGRLDVALGDLDSVLAMWKVRNARQAGWTNGEVCWHLRDAPLLRREYVARLDRMVAFAGRGLLVPRLGIGGTTA